MASSTTTINTSNIIDSVVKEVGDIMSTRLSRVCADYALYKESHDAILAIPAVQRAIRDGPRFKQEPEEQGGEAEEEASSQELTRIQSQLTQCFEVIKSLQSELQMVKLENDALRLQLQRDPQPETRMDSPTPSENITLIIEETESFDLVVTAGGCDEEEEEAAQEEEQEVQVKNEEEDQAGEEEEEEDQDTVYEEEEQEEQEEQEEAEEGEEQEEEQEQEEAEEDEEQEEAEEGEEQEEEQEQEQEQEEEVEVVEVEIKGKMYFTTNETSGIIYECLADGDIGDEIGKFVKGKPVFNTKK